ncbi:integrase core domain-containing protein [Thalassoglobus sp.]|uniref:integrase core domain-containing protein n=1 Tax=Thalassoglobus sp. TaxID=2795869 RepID=UPI003AA7CB38
MDDQILTEIFSLRMEQFFGADHYLNEHWFLSLEDAQSKVDDWRRDYNENRPHNALNNETPEALAQASHMTSRGKLPRKRRNE